MREARFDSELPAVHGIEKKFTNGSRKISHLQKHFFETNRPARLAYVTKSSIGKKHLGKKYSRNRFLCYYCKYFFVTKNR